MSTEPHTGVPRAGQRFSQNSRTMLIAYARWLDSITWKRFFLLALLSIIAVNILSEIPPFSTRWGAEPPTETESVMKIERKSPAPASAPEAVVPPSPSPSASEATTDASPKAPATTEPKVAPAPAPKGQPGFVDLDVRIGPNSVTVTRPDAETKATQSASAALPANAAASAVSPPRATVIDIRSDGIRINEEEMRVIEEKIDAALENAMNEDGKPIVHRITQGGSRGFSLGDHLPNLMMFIIIASIVIKLMARGRFQAEERAEAAKADAEAEALKRQLVEARMSVMQAQIEPHFLFNTLASVDQLIESHPDRARRMLDNLTTLLRAAMPTLREATALSPRALSRELDIVKPYVDILKVRMDERLVDQWNVPHGLMTAEFPPMMLQGLVENAIRHGLEPKPEGGTLTVEADIVDGKLRVQVIDTGVGYKSVSSTSGTGTGLNSMRERLQSLYGQAASLTVKETAGGGTTVIILLPYRPLPSGVSQ